MKIAPREFQEARRRAARQRVYHVIPSDGAWVVKRAGTQRASRVFPTQEEALAFVGVKSSVTSSTAPGLKDVGEVVVHNRNGGIESRILPIRDAKGPAED